MSKKPAPTPELVAIREAAQRLAIANRELTVRAEMQQRELAAAVAPIAEKHRAGIDEAAQARAEADAALDALLKASPSLFISPRSMTVDGVKCGYRKEEDSLDWGDEDLVIKRIEDLHPELYDLLVREKKTLVADALAQLEPRQLAHIGVHLISGADRSFISIGDSDVDKLVKAILADAQRRVADEDKPAKKRTKATAKARTREVA
jgi:hypothetical protein